MVDEDCKKLNKVKAKAFHNIVTKALYIMKRARPDISVAIAFLTTRVREPDHDDWEKLSHLMKYLRGTKELPLTLGAEGTGIVKWYVDASFAVHPNAQGYEITENLLYQDNKSSILLEKNGKSSSGKRTRHISIRYFFVTDRIAKGELSLEWCPTKDMIADFMTKPLQGFLFKKFRDIIMGIETIKSGDAVSEKPGNDSGNAKSKGLQATKRKSIGMNSLARC